jgi:DMSO/TMAO reductase YedYZ molybdopterin-dependent catalytic subunit
MSSRALDPRGAVGLDPGDRVQRPTENFPVLHLETEIPAASWDVVVDGLVTNPTKWSLNSVASMASERRIWDLNCVWGWSKLQCVWDGVPAGRLIDAAQPLPEARFVMASSVGGGYTSCFSLKRARRSLLAWSLDGAELTPEHGGPLRLVPPPTKWAYKGVKWISRLTLIEAFTPGFWEELVGDPHGDIPTKVLDHVDGAQREPVLHLPHGLRPPATQPPVLEKEATHE